MPATSNRRPVSIYKISESFDSSKRNEPAPQGEPHTRQASQRGNRMQMRILLSIMLKAGKSHPFEKILASQWLYLNEPKRPKIGF